MNQNQKEVQQHFLNTEKEVMKKLENSYEQSLKTINDRISNLKLDIGKLQAEYDWLDDDDPEKVKIKSQIQSKVYQKGYQQALQGQVNDILDKLHTQNYTAISAYLKGCYEDGYIGTMYDLQGQGIPLIMPIDQKAVVQAIQLDSKISKSLYTKLGENVNQLKRTITAELSRGIVTGMSYSQVAQQIKLKMTGTYNTKGGAFGRALTIARTEGHRIQVQAGMNACNDAKSMGADVLKQWDSTLDGLTRPSHRVADGEIRELDEEFSNGLMFPGDPNGKAAEVINCRCALLQRARWALDDEELETLKEKAAFFGLDKSENFEDFKKKYLEVTAPTPIPEVKPKKEYLTEKKLKQLIDDADAQLQQLKDEFNQSGWGYDKAEKAISELEKVGEEYAAPFKDLKKKIDDLDAKKLEWSEKLNKKVTAKESKKLKKEQILLQDELNKFDDTETFSGIWYNQDDVTINDWKSKQSSIQKKIDYYEDQIQLAKQSGIQDDVDKYTDLLNKVKDFDSKGSAYWKVKDDLNKNKATLTKLQKSGKIKGQESAYSQERKDNALWAKQVRDADDRCREKSGEVWRNASDREKYAAYDYTCGSGKFNRPLSGFQKPYYEPGTGWESKYYKGVNNVWLDYEGAGDEIRELTNLVSQSTYDFDMWLQRGCGGNAMESFLNLSPDTFTRMSDSDLQQFVGKSNRMYSFTSTGVAKGKGFSGDCILNIYAPSGTQMLYAEPFSEFGYGDKLKWDGISTQSKFGYEAEMLIQRGAYYKITKIEKSNGTIYIDMEVHPEQGYDLIQQDPSEWKGSTEKGR